MLHGSAVLGAAGEGPVSCSWHWLLKTREGGRMGLFILGTFTCEMLWAAISERLPACCPRDEMCRRCESACPAQGEGRQLQRDVSFSVLLLRMRCPLLMS